MNKSKTDTDIHELNKEILRLNTHCSDLSDLLDAAQKRENGQLALIQKLMSENSQLKDEIQRKNVRGAGRKYHNDQWTESYLQFCSAYESAATVEEIMDKLQISRATFYRYRKLYLEKNVFA